MANDCLAAIRPVSDFARINARGGPGMQHAVVMELAVGTSGLRVLDVQPDARGNSSNGRVYQWLKLALPEGEGWVRDDLVEIQGACSLFGYGSVALPTRASTLTRTPPADDDSPAEKERIRKAAFAVTSGFEGGGYDTYQTYDSGIVSYGRFQCTLASGGLEKLLESYLSRASGMSAEQLRSIYMPRIHAKDPSLRDDTGLKDLLIRLSRDPAMQAAQNEYVTDAYWNTAYRQSILPRGIETPLGQALIFDMAINHGNWGAERDFLRPAEQSLGAGIRSKLGENGLSEQQLLRRVAQIRRDRLYALAAARGYGGLRPRGDFWVERIEAGDWDLNGDNKGEVSLGNGKRVQVKAP